MVYSRIIAGILSLLAVTFSGAAARAATPDAAEPGTATPGATLIDITGEVSMAGLSGGVADPVPLFIGSSGPVIFVMNANPGEEALARAHQTHIRANPELNRPR